MQATRAARTSVGLAEIFPPEAIVVGLKDRTKQGVIADLARHLAGLRTIVEDQVAIVVESILAQEKFGSTALYQGGVAFPHCRSSCTERFVGALGIEPNGIPFEEVTGGAVHAVFLLLAPLDRREELYSILGRFTALGRDKSRCAQLRGCRTAAAAHHFLLELDSQ
jgi:mannitol/fructose-specific phosphotransferase system IIA component (Ntr-type)